MRIRSTYFLLISVGHYKCESNDLMFGTIAKGQSQDEVIKAYRQLIRNMPRQNQYLLLYVLDLLSVFARKADKNLMTATSKLVSLLSLYFLRTSLTLTNSQLFFLLLYYLL